MIWKQEEKVQILIAIHTSLLVIAKEAALLRAAGVPEMDAMIIMGATINSHGELGTSMGE